MPFPQMRRAVAPHNLERRPDMTLQQMTGNAGVELLRARLMPLHN
jgi:hypothetical protein